MPPKGAKVKTMTTQQARKKAEKLNQRAGELSAMLDTLNTCQEEEKRKQRSAEDMSKYPGQVYAEEWKIAANTHKRHAANLGAIYDKLYIELCDICDKLSALREEFRIYDI